MEKRWIFKDVFDKKELQSLSSALSIDETLATLLLQRGITTFEEAKKFFRPTVEDLHDPFLMKDMDLAVTRLEHAIDTKEKILIYGDYDVDGTTSVALVFDFLATLHPHIDYYIPDRYTEGYGISTQGIEWAKENQYSLIISLDCGVKSIDKITYAKSLGVDFIVCDHHLPGDELPPAEAVLDAKRQDCAYPYKELCGCGVGFKLMQALCMKRGIASTTLFEYLDLVAIAICSDIVPITEENRAMVYLGLEQLNKNQRPGVKALSDVAGYKKLREVTHIVFGLGPRINAAGRIAHAKAAVQLLISKTPEEAEVLAAALNEKNTTRKDFDSTITQEALQLIEKEMLVKDSRSTVLYNEGWHKGVVGIVASRCIETYYRPTIILTKSGNFAAGSARSVLGFDVHQAIASCHHLLEQYGGHMYAAGLTLKLENVALFKEAFEKAVASTIKPEQLIPQIEVDKKIELSEITPKFYRIIKQMAPFGPQNMQPVFVVENLRAPTSVKLLKELHLKLSLKASNGTVYEAIGFSMPQYFERIKKGDKFNLCFSINENEFNGMTSLQLQIRDLKFVQ